MISDQQIPVEEDPTPTQKIWRPVSDLDRAQQLAFQDFASAMSVGDVEAAGKAKQRIDDIEAEQMQAHAAARAYLVEKARKGQL